MRRTAIDCLNQEFLVSLDQAGHKSKVSKWEWEELMKYPLILLCTRHYSCCVDNKTIVIKIKLLSLMGTELNCLIAAPYSYLIHLKSKCSEKNWTENLNYNEHGIYRAQIKLTWFFTTLESNQCQCFLSNLSLIDHKNQISYL